MRRALVLFLFALPAVAQTSNKVLVQAISQLCRGSAMARIDSNDADPKVTDNLGNPITAGDPLADPIFVASTRRLVAAFKPAHPDVLVVIALASSNTINAWAYPDWAFESVTNRRVGLVCVPTGFVRFMGDEDELAFMIAHELGHVVDDACRSTVESQSYSRGKQISV
jgi:Zn-dependent protease with chaperone function